MKRIMFAMSGALVVLGLALGTPDAFAQSRGHSGGGGGGARTNSGGGSGGGTAVSRGSGGTSSGGSGHVSGSSGGRVSGPSSTASSGSGGQAVGRDGSRSNNDGRPVVGQAVPRTGAYYGRGGRYSYYPYDPYYFYGYGAFGLGAFYYDPFWWGYPYGGYGYYGGGYGYYGGGYGYAYDPQDAYGVKGGLKLKVSPKDAEVYVDGYYVGIVDDYDGAFQRLNLVAGTHRIEFKAKGYEPLTVEVKIEPRETISYRGDLTLQAATK